MTKQQSAQDGAEGFVDREIRKYQDKVLDRLRHGTAHEHLAAEIAREAANKIRINLKARAEWLNRKGTKTPRGAS